MLSPAIAQVIGQLTAGPTDHELDGLAAALAAFRAHVVPSPTPPRRRTMFSMLAGAKIGATLGGVAAGLGGVATVVLISANVPSGTEPPMAPAQSRPAVVGTSTAGTPQGPDANGPAKHGLCTAWKARTGGPGNSEKSVAFTNLAKAAGGASKIAAFCADVAAPGAKGGSAGQGNGKAGDKQTGKPTGKPTDKPTGKPTGKATEKPDDEDSAKPTVKPTVTPTVKPTEEPTGKPSVTSQATPSLPATGTPTPTVTGSTGPSSSSTS